MDEEPVLYSPDPNQRVFSSSSWFIVPTGALYSLNQPIMSWLFLGNHLICIFYIVRNICVDYSRDLYSCKSLELSLLTSIAFTVLSHLSFYTLRNREVGGFYKKETREPGEHAGGQPFSPVCHNSRCDSEDDSHSIIFAFFQMLLKRT